MQAVATAQVPMTLQKQLTCTLTVLILFFIFLKILDHQSLYLYVIERMSGCYNNKKW